MNQYSDMSYDELCETIMDLANDMQGRDENDDDGWVSYDITHINMCLEVLTQKIYARSEFEA
jgi:hypothetical protein